MRFSSTLTLSLLSVYARHPSASGATFKKDPFRLERILQKKEAAAAAAYASLLSAPTNNRQRAPANDRQQRKLVKKANGKAKGNDVGGSGGAGGYYFEEMPDNEHSAQMDENDAGVAVDATEYEYGAPVAVTFELTNDLVPTDVLETLKVDNKGKWTVGLFMRMADPQGGSLTPIVSITPNIDCGVNRRALQGEGVVDQDAGGRVPAAGQADPMGAYMEDPPLPDPSVIPNLDCVGEATFTASHTALSVLKDIEYGTGFDVFLLDEDGGAIIGPATFYMVKAGSPAAVAVASGKGQSGKKKPQHPLLQYSQGQTKPATGGVGAQSYGEGGAGIGSGTGKDGGMIISTDASLANYILTTNKLFYDMGNNVVVTYDLRPASSDGRRRFLQKKGKNGGGVGDGSLTGDSETTTTTTSSTAAADTTPANTIPTAPGPDDVMGSSSGDGFLGDELEPQPGNDVDLVDPDDITLYKMGVYMRMAHPQDGELPPLLEMPFCDNPANCGRTPAQLKGAFSFGTDELDTLKNGLGFDVWILNGLGHGIAGPRTFYILPDDTL